MSTFNANIAHNWLLLVGKNGVGKNGTNKVMEKMDYSRTVFLKFVDIKMCGRSFPKFPSQPA